MKLVESVKAPIKLALLKAFRYIANHHNVHLIRAGCADPAYRLVNPVLKLHDSSFYQMSSEEAWFYSFDVVRYATLQLLSQEIYEHNIEGAVAELGVYKGLFSSVINSYFPERKIYLFDTFEGFDSRDVQTEKERGNEHKLINHKLFCDSNVKLVTSRMFHQDNVVVKKGWFPESAVGECEDEKFCFVSLDADLYQPIYAGLCWFYPRLVNGGYIMVNDYSIKAFEGTKKAVQEFAKETGISYIPIPDRAGSAVIAKPRVATN